MKKFLSLAMCLCAIVVAMTSCSKSNSNNPLIGKWEQIVDEQGARAEITYDFSASGDMTQTFSLTSDVMSVEAEGTCDYTFENGTITFSFSADDFEFSEFTIEGVDQSIIDASMEQMKAGMVDVEQTLSNVVINGDELTATFNGQRIVLNRI